MATFTNLSPYPVDLTDENGITFHFDGAESRTGLSNYFSNYTSAFLTRPILRLVGSLDGDGSLPAPGYRNENMAFEPGPSVPHSFTATATDAASPAVAPVDLTSAFGPRSKRIAWDMQNETSDTARRIDTNYVGIPEVPTLRHETTAIAISGLNASTTPTVNSSYLPVKENGVQATAADAAANLAVTEGDNYTAFGTITVTNASPSESGLFYYSIKGTGDELFVADSGNSATLPTPDTAAIVLATGVITLTAFGNGGAAGDSGVVTITAALHPNTAAKAAAAFGALDSYQSGYYRNSVSGRLFLVEGTTVNAFHSDAAATIS